MKNQARFREGFALIEALVVVLVVAVGLLALAGFHGDLMSGSGLSKARGEAMMLAREKLEALSNNIQKNQFDSSVVNTGSPESIAGKNASFSRSWQIRDVDADANAFKEVTVRVTWDDPKAKAQQVSLNSLLLFNDPDKVGDISTSGDESPWAGGINPKRSGKKGPDMEAGATLTGSATWLTIPDIPANSFKWQFNSKGNIVLLDGANPANVLYTFFGQSLQSTSGRVYYDQPDFLAADGTPELTVFASEPAYCASFPIGTETCPDAVKAKKGEQCAIGGYVCFYSGDCQNGDTGDLGVLDCGTFNPGGAADFTDVNGLDGGWYGKIGFARKDNADMLKKTVCQADIDNTSQTNSAAREYITVRPDGQVCGKDANNVDILCDKYEGINQSFTCHNFVIAEMTDELATCSDLVNSFSASPPDVGLPSSKVRRYLSGNAANQAQALSNFWCSAVNILAKAGNASSSRKIRSASASGSTSTWPEDECVAWPLGDGFSCSVPDGWTGTITLTVINGATPPATCTCPPITVATAPTTQSTRLTDVTLCTP
jgi:Tfp pilus assembly protein PilV